MNNAKTSRLGFIYYQSSTRKRVQSYTSENSDKSIRTQQSCSSNGTENLQRNQEGLSDSQSATIYKTVQVLKEAGLVQELNLPNDQSRFDPNMEPHVHLVCLLCKSVNDWMDPMISKIVERVSNEADFSTGRWNLDIFGICSSCDRRR